LQFGVLRATGLSVGQLIGLLTTEQLSLIGVGITLGTGLGAGAGWMFTRFLQVSIIARESVPPFLIVTPWSTVFQLYVILVIVFLVALSVSVTLLRRMQVSAVLRLGEQ
jgi:putative ABC transport system permease protein